MREDMVRVLDQRDILVKENEKLQQQLEEERQKVAALEEKLQQDQLLSKSGA
ncbi:hypothetical protein GLW04_12935 [Halobacillus litoralis]|uniref:Uncharacterized protein n=1 Tax=Halobacillus litoralis TaxID=45668 RepID=A0A845DTI9_9BACI|nr:hypothetical protein [Halobacillus halophilus]MYL20800.1 hypothetical protein [Halobacillus litoralis]MYL30841.1 hypothetical protein [Halobacillus halophilus]